MKRRGITESKKGLEVSMGMMITIVIAVITLILALTLLRNLFTGATTSVTSVNQQLAKEIDKIFADENKKLVVYLGQDKTAKIRAGTTNFGIAIASQTITNSRISNVSQVQYKFELDESNPTSCVKAVLGKAKTASLIKTTLNTWLDSTGASGPTSNYIIFLSIPEDTQICTQPIRVTAIDRTVVPEGEVIAIDTFNVEILKKGLF
jgi:hypothetical protein